MIPREVMGRATKWSNILQMICDPEEDVVWRVTIGEPEVSMRYIGYVKKPNYSTITYPTLDKCPDWVKNRIAVLNMMPPDPNKSVVVGLGRRVNLNTFWIVQPEDADGIDP